MDTWLDKLLIWRRHLHKYPELSFEERETTTYIVNELSGLPGVKVETGREALGLDTGVMVTVGNGTKPIVGMRADIDALPIKEKNSAAYRSTKPGIMHACGHDGHTAMLLGAVHQLSAKFAEGTLNGTVKCLFQPAEETEDEYGKTGAMYVLESNVLADICAMVALHLDPELPLGKVKLKEGVVMANVDTFAMTIHGTGGHGAYPEQTIDPIWLTSLILPAIYGLSSRKVAALEPSVVSITQLSCGTQANIIPSSVSLRGTIRSYSEDVRLQLRKELIQILDTIRSMNGTYSLKIHSGEPALYNDPMIADLLAEAVKEAYPPIEILAEAYGMGGEDFSHIANEIPAAMLFLGAKDESQADTSLHQPTFCFDEKALLIGMNTLVESALRLLKKGGNENGS